MLRDNLHGLRQIKNMYGLIFQRFQKRKLLKEDTHCLIASLDLIIFMWYDKKGRGVYYEKNYIINCNGFFINIML